MKRFPGILLAATLFASAAFAQSPPNTNLMVPNGGGGSAVTGNTGITCTSNVCGLALNSATLQQSPTNPATTTAGSPGVMMGLGKDQAGTGAHPCAITPVFSGRVRVDLTFEVESGTAGNTFQLKLMFGTGTAPSNGVATTGTQVGPTRIPIQNVAADNMSVTIPAVITGLTPGTAIWLDVSAAGNGTNAVAILNVGCEGLEF